MNAAGSSKSNHPSESRNTCFWQRVKASGSLGVLPTMLNDRRRFKQSPPACRPAFKMELCVTFSLFWLQNTFF